MAAARQCACGRRHYFSWPSSQRHGSVAEVPFKVQPLLGVDLDGTIRRSKSGAIYGPTDPDDVELYPDVEARLWSFKDSGFRIVGVSNQGVVGFGTCTEVHVEAIATATRAAFARDPFDDIELAYALPASKGGKVAPHNVRSLRRKPGYGMLVSAERVAFEAGIVVDWDRSLMIGDRIEDQQCATAAGVAFQWAWDFFERPPPDAGK